MKKLWNGVKDWLPLIGIIMFISIWLWLPPLLAQLTYGDWTCAYKECVVVKGVKNE